MCATTIIEYTICWSQFGKSEVPQVLFGRKLEGSHSLFYCYFDKINIKGNETMMLIYSPLFTDMN